MTTHTYITKFVSAEDETVDPVTYVFEGKDTREHLEFAHIQHCQYGTFSVSLNLYQGEEYYALWSYPKEFKSAALAMSWIMQNHDMIARDRIEQSKE